MSREEQLIKQLEAKISRLKSSVAELKVLNEIAVTSGKATDIDQVLNLIMQKSISALEAEQGSILLVTKNKNKQVKTFVRQDDTSSLEHNYHIGTHITGWVLLNKKPLIIEDLSNDQRFEPSDDEKKDIRSVLCVPIWFEGDIIGLMMLINKKNEKHFSNADITLFSIISVQAGQLIKNLELQRKSFQERKESEKLQELDRLKTNFFTNISHEFRTPLTLILGPAKQILEQTEKSKIGELAGIIFKSGTKLKNLTNQILDLSRIEAGQMKLKAARGNLVRIIGSIVSAFQSLAETKKISLQFASRDEKIILYFDNDKIDKIITNLLSNALKFTPEGGLVKVEVGTSPNLNFLFNKNENKKSIVEIIVMDSGIGISNEKLNKIFDRFYQVESNITHEYESTGIGLALTKELVELHKGKIFVESKKGKGTIFKIYLPMGKDHLLPDEIAEEEEFEVNDEFEENEESKVLPPSYLQSGLSNKDSFLEQNNDENFDPDVISRGQTNKPIVLIIEDNSDLRQYIADILNNYYKITEASDGKEGLDKSFEVMPDLIVSDIMIPELDGISLCGELKSDTRTSHIPLILLTAKSDTSDKVEGLEAGADDYITKPFEKSELKARIKNLLVQRRRIHKHFQKRGFLVDEDEITPIDQKFLKQLLLKINDHIPDLDYSVEKLAGDLAVSRSLLHKKLIALVGESPSDVLKRIRLNKAAELIKQKSGNISEIALEVGFNSPSYFTKCFQKQFGFNPSQYHRNLTRQ
jgi:signal transduction histidine kinase/AraC-like DNA-binding protein